MSIEMPKQEVIKKTPTTESLVEKAGANPKAQEAARKAMLLDQKTEQLMNMLAGARKKTESAGQPKPQEKTQDYWGGVDTKRPSSLQ